MLAIVQYQQHVLRPKITAEPSFQLLLLDHRHAKRLREGGEHQFILGQRRQIDPPHTVAVAFGQLVGNLDGEPGFATSTWPGERQKSCLWLQPNLSSFQQSLQLGNLLLAADEAGQGDRRLSVWSVREGPDGGADLMRL